MYNFLLIGGHKYHVIIILKGEQIYYDENNDIIYMQAGISLRYNSILEGVEVWKTSQVHKKCLK